MAVEFPVYDYPLFGNEPPTVSEGSEDMPFGVDYKGVTTDPLTVAVNSLFRTDNNAPIEPSGETPSTDFLSDVGNIVSAPFKALGSAASGLVEGASTKIRNTYLYLIGGVLLIGVLMIVLLGAGTRFMGSVERIQP